MPLSWPSKDPGASLNYALDWSRFLNTDTITDSSWTISDSSLVSVDDSFTAKVATIKLAQGVLNQTYTLVNTVTLASTQIAVQHVTIKIATS